MGRSDDWVGHDSVWGGIFFLVWHIRRRVDLERRGVRGSGLEGIDGRPLRSMAAVEVQLAYRGSNSSVGLALGAHLSLNRVACDSTVAVPCCLCRVAHVCVDADM